MTGEISPVEDIDMKLQAILLLILLLVFTAPVVVLAQGGDDPTPADSIDAVPAVVADDFGMTEMIALGSMAISVLAIGFTAYQANRGDLAALSENLRTNAEFMQVLRDGLNNTVPKDVVDMIARGSVIVAHGADAIGDLAQAVATATGDDERRVGEIELPLPPGVTAEQAREAAYDAVMALAPKAPPVNDEPLKDLSASPLGS